MPTYKQWNKAISEYFSEGLQVGSIFYLSVDDNALDDIGEVHFAQEADVETVQDFLEAVRRECVRNLGTRISLVGISDMPTGKDAPNCVAFLAAMVLAAHRMETDIEVTTANYFTRFREVFDLSTDKEGRPLGLNPAGREEALWWTLNLWIMRNGWIPSARRGRDISSRFINYPISQALLREGDKRHIEQKIRQDAKGVFDRERIGVWFQESAYGLPTAYLRNLANEAKTATRERFDAIIGAVYNAYLEIDWSASLESVYQAKSVRSRRAIHRLTSGLYRDEDFLFGTVNYYPYPEKPVHLNARELYVYNGEESELLEEERENKFVPLPWQANLKQGQKYSMKGASGIFDLVLPDKDFWILIRDPYDESSGVFASWGHPTTGEPFLLLCDASVRPQAEFLKEKHLLSWKREYPLPEPYIGFIEYRECEILTENWNEVSYSNSALFKALKPRDSASISLRGGLKAGGNRNAWMVGYLPKLVVSSASDPVVRMLDAMHTGSPLLNSPVSSGEPITLPEVQEGEYFIEILIADERASIRRMSVVDWESLVPINRPDPFGEKVGGYVLTGGLLNEERATK